jgi:hypothetical protein
MDDFSPFAAQARSNSGISVSTEAVDRRGFRTVGSVEPDDRVDMYDATPSSWRGPLSLSVTSFSTASSLLRNAQRARRLR